MRITIFAFMTILFTIVLMGCSSGNRGDQSVLAEVAGEKVLLEDVSGNPTFLMLVDNLITEKMVLQEFEARQLVLSDDKFEKEWDRFVLARGQGDELRLVQELRPQGITLDYMKKQIRTQVKFQQLLEDEFPITLEDARKNFEGNLSANQRMYAGNVPEKQDNPETITFEDVSEFVIDNMNRHLLTSEAQNIIISLKDEYNNKGWIKNYVRPEEMKDLTTIKPKADKVQELDASKLKTAPVRKTNPEQPDEHDDSEQKENSDDPDENIPDDTKEEQHNH